VAANLLEAALLCDPVCEAASEEALFEAADYGVRSVRAARPGRGRAGQRTHPRAARADPALAPAPAAAVPGQPALHSGLARRVRAVSTAVRGAPARPSLTRALAGALRTRRSPARAKMRPKRMRC